MERATIEVDQQIEKFDAWKKNWQESQQKEQPKSEPVAEVGPYEGEGWDS